MWKRQVDCSFTDLVSKYLLTACVCTYVWAGYWDYRVNPDLMGLTIGDGFASTEAQEHVVGEMWVHSGYNCVCTGGGGDAVDYSSMEDWPRLCIGLFAEA